MAYLLLFVPKHLFYLLTLKKICNNNLKFYLSFNLKVELLHG